MGTNGAISAFKATESRTVDPIIFVVIPGQTTPLPGSEDNTEVSTAGATGAPRFDWKTSLTDLLGMVSWAVEEIPPWMSGGRKTPLTYLLPVVEIKIFGGSGPALAKAMRAKAAMKTYNIKKCWNWIPPRTGKTGKS